MIQRAFGVTRINAKTNGVLEVVPRNSAYFEPRRVRFRSFDCTGENLDSLDFKIGAATVGGSPQLSINTLTPDERCVTGSISPKDLDRVCWSVFSTNGLARELQVSIYNPHDVDLIIYMYIEGVEIESLDCYPDLPVGDSLKELAIRDFDCPYCKAKAGEPCQKKSKKPIGPGFAHKSRIDAANLPQVPKVVVDEPSWHPDRLNLLPVSSETVNIPPFGQRFVRVIPTVSPYYKPYGLRIHAYNRESCDVPVVVSDLICGNRMELGGAISIINEFSEFSGQIHLEDDPYAALNEVRKYIEGMQNGTADYIRRKKIKNARVPIIAGIPNTLLEDPGLGGWGDISGFPVFSTLGLGRAFCVLLYNPWPFSVQASAVVNGDMRSSLKRVDTV